MSVGLLGTAGLNFLYWWFAARTLSAQAVGYGSATVSLLALLALLAECGLGPLLIGELGRTRDPNPLIRASLLLSTLAASALGIVFLVVSGLLGTGLGRITSSWTGAGLFVMSCGLAGLTFVVDQACLGLLRADLQMVRSLAFGAVRLILLAGIAWLPIAGADESFILGTWILAQVATLALLVPSGILRWPERWGTCRLTILRPLLRRAAAHQALNIAVQAPGYLLPFVVTAIVSPAANAPFYSALMLLSAALLIPSSLSTMVLAVGAREPERLAARLRLSLGISAAVASAAAVGFALLSTFILALFSPTYPAIVGTGLGMLGLSALATVCKVHYVLIARLHGSMLPAAVLTGAGAVLELAGAILGGSHAGLSGVVAGWLAALAVEAACMLPVVARAALGRGAAVEPRTPAAGEAA